MGLLPTDDTGFRLRFRERSQKVGQNRIHFDLTSASVEDQQGRSLRRSTSALATSTSANCRTRGTWCSPTPRGTSSA